MGPILGPTWLEARGSRRALGNGEQGTQQCPPGNARHCWYDCAGVAYGQAHFPVRCTWFFLTPHMDLHFCQDYSTSLEYATSLELAARMCNVIRASDSAFIFKDGTHCHPGGFCISTIQLYLTFLI